MAIKSFAHKGLERFYLTGKTSGIHVAHASKLRSQLAMLSVARVPGDLRAWSMHALKGDRKGSWSIVVSANWRLTFRFEGEDVVVLNYEDYH